MLKKTLEIHWNYDFKSIIHLKMHENYDLKFIKNYYQKFIKNDQKWIKTLKFQINSTFKNSWKLSFRIHSNRKLKLPNKKPLWIWNKWI